MGFRSVSPGGAMTDQTIWNTRRNATALPQWRRCRPIDAPCSHLPRCGVAGGECKQGDRAESTIGVASPPS